MVAPLRVVVYDRTCRGRPGLPGLSHAWSAGGVLYASLGRVDAWHGAAGWAEALTWLAEVEPGAPIGEVQIWSHGNWGCARIGSDVLDEAALDRGHGLAGGLDALAARLPPDGGGLLWLRCCETFGTARGKSFARTLAARLGCRVAGHTYVIGVLQSGLHALRPGERPAWPDDEGLPAGAAEPRHALPSRRSAPNTVTFLTGQVPDGY